MNVLILTPDRVGSTLLQRLLTVYMLGKKFDKPVVNLHELSNGLIKYHNSTMNQEVLGKPDGANWGYFQSLPEITDMLSSVDHYKTSRLAHYHLVRRNDSLNDQIKFYEYLNKNFYIIGCRRENLFEHGLSWAIHAHSKILNAYSPQEKIEKFQKIYNDGITVNKEGLEKYLTAYVSYMTWANTYFNIQSYFDYDTHMGKIEEYILNLDFMQGSSGNGWKNMFEQSFEDWNACHRLIPNLFLRNPTDTKNAKQLVINTRHIPDENWKQIRGNDWPETWADFNEQDLPVVIHQEIVSRLALETVPVTVDEYNFFSKNLPGYKNTVEHISKLESDGFLVTGIPIKLQSLNEKKQIIKNFDDCVTWYNQWVDKNNFGKHYSTLNLNLLAHAEESRLNQPIQSQLGHVNSKFLSS